MVRRVFVAPRRWIIVHLIAYISMLVLVIVAVQYAVWVDRRSNQRWCGIVEMSDDTYTATPPTSPTGQRIAEEMKKLRREFDCKPR